MILCSGEKDDVHLKNNFMNKRMFCSLCDTLHVIG